MHLLNDTQAIFEQLAHTPDGEGLAVRVVIENHDACFHNEEVGALVTAVMRARMAGMPRDVVQQARIDRQRRTLGVLVTPIKSRYVSAG